MHKQRHIFILLLKGLGLHFQRCKTEITSGMPLEGLAGESCLVETLKKTTESNTLLFSQMQPLPKGSLKPNTHKHTQTCAHKATKNLFYPKFKIVSKSPSSLLQPSTWKNPKSLIQSLSPLAGGTVNSLLCFSLIYSILFTKASGSAESDLSQTLFTSLQVFSSYR